MSQNQESSEEYLVVINGEEQYSIWPSYKPVPKGWKQVDKPGSKEQCLEYIEKNWTDMRPLSLRKQMQKISDDEAARAINNRMHENDKKSSLEKSAPSEATSHS